MTLPDQKTTDKIATELRRLGLHALAKRAATGEFSDFSSPHPFPQHVLVAELDRSARFRLVPDLQGVADMRNAVISGEYDSTPEESAAWGESEDGKQALRDIGMSAEELAEEYGPMTEESAKRFFKDHWR